MPPRSPNDFSLSRIVAEAIRSGRTPEIEFAQPGPPPPSESALPVIVNLGDLRPSGVPVTSIVSIDPAAQTPMIPGRASGSMSLSRTLVYHRAREFAREQAMRIGRRSGMTQAAHAMMVRAMLDGREIQAEVHDPRLQSMIQSGVRVGLSMGTRVDSSIAPEWTSQVLDEVIPARQPYIEASWVAEPARPSTWNGVPRLRCPVCGGDHLIEDCSRIDGPTPNWVNNAADPQARTDEVVNMAPPRRVNVPEFEVASNPTVGIRDFVSRRFDLIDRDYVPGQAIGERFRQERGQTHENHHQDYRQDIRSPRPEPPRPYCPTSWERILVGWLED